MLPASGTAPGSPNPPASSAGVSPRGSSSRASGLPRVSATIWSRTRVSSGPGSTESSSARASASRSPPTASSGQAGQVAARVPGREHQADRFRAQPAGDERQHLRRGAVEPLLVVDQAQQRLLAAAPRTAGSARPGRPGTGPAPARRSGRTRCAARRAAARAARPGGPASARTAGAAPANASSISDWTPAARDDPAAGRVPGQVARAAPSCRPRPRRAAPAPGSRRRGRPPPAASSTPHSARRPASSATRRAGLSPGRRTRPRYPPAGRGARRRASTGSATPGRHSARRSARRASSTRDLMPSLMNTCRRCEFTVYGDR